MESLERLAGGLAQLELLLASLRRENRDLAGRLAAAAAERRQTVDAAEARLTALTRELEAAHSEPRANPDLEARARQAELESADLASQLERSRQEHEDEKGRLETLLRHLEAQVMADRGAEQLPVASAEAFAEAVAAQAQAQTALAEAQARVLTLEARLEEAERTPAPAPETGEQAALRQRLVELERLALDSAGLGERAAKLEAERADLKRKQRELAAFVKERSTLRRKVDELVNTLESVRLG